MAKRKTNVPKEETKREKFKRVVEPRVRKALKTIRLIGNCSGGAYEYNPDDIVSILGSLGSELEALEARYENKGVSAIDFNLG